MKNKLLNSGIIGFLGISMALLGCKNIQPVSVDPQGSGEGVAMVKITAAANSPFKLIARMAMLTISAPDMLTITKELVVTDTSVQGTIPGIPAGKHRLFQVNVYDSLETIQYRGSAYADVIADSTVKVTISIVRVGGVAIINGTVVEGPSPMDSGLIAFWSFDSVSSNTYYDVTGHGYNALSTGTGLSLVSGIKGQALNFSGSSFDCVVQNSSEIFNSNKFTIETWYYSSVDPASGTNLGQIFDYQLIASGVRNGYALYVEPNGVVDFGMASKDGSYYTDVLSKTIFKQKTWYHIAAVYDSLSLKVFINGILEGSVSQAGGYLAPHANARIGCQSLIDGTIFGRLNATLDELKFFGYASPADSILAHYNALKLN